MHFHAIRAKLSTPERASDGMSCTFSKGNSLWCAYPESKFELCLDHQFPAPMRAVQGHANDQTRYVELQGV
jgi:hypothetical protein